MPRVCAILPQVSAYPRVRPSRCQYCGCGILYIHTHGEVPKRVKDIYALEVMAMRYRRVGRGRAFARYPQDVDRSEHSIRLRAPMWALGLSRKPVAHPLVCVGGAGV